MSLENLNSWIEKSQVSRDIFTLGQAQLLEATIKSISNGQLKNNEFLPPLWHWIYFHEASSIDKLGRDGHAAKGDFLPPIDLPRRMWAGGRLTYERHPKIGQKITRNSTIKDITPKDGKSGKLCFVTVLHEFLDQDEQIIFTEEQDLVYREDQTDTSARAPIITPPDNPTISEKISPSPVLLFRYSALTFNSHRIHYDRDYCAEVEGYPGLVFHGPLTATLLANLAMQQNPGKKLQSFSFRATAPLFDTQPFEIKTDGATTYWAETPEGSLAMKAKATFG